MPYHIKDIFCSVGIDLTGYTLINEDINDQRIVFEKLRAWQNYGCVSQYSLGVDGVIHYNKFCTSIRKDSKEPDQREMDKFEMSENNAKLILATYGEIVDIDPTEHFKFLIRNFSSVQQFLETRHRTTMLDRRDPKPSCV